jgi:hypothetical protein
MPNAAYNTSEYWVLSSRDQPTRRACRPRDRLHPKGSLHQPGYLFIGPGIARASAKRCTFGCSHHQSCPPFGPFELHACFHSNMTVSWRIISRPGSMSISFYCVLISTSCCILLYLEWPCLSFVEFSIELIANLQHKECGLSHCNLDGRTPASPRIGPRGVLKKSKFWQNSYLFNSMLRLKGRAPVKWSQWGQLLLV